MLRKNERGIFTGWRYTTGDRYLAYLAFVIISLFKYLSIFLSHIFTFLITSSRTGVFHICHHQTWTNTFPIAFVSIQLLKWYQCPDINTISIFWSRYCRCGTMTFKLGFYPYQFMKSKVLMPQNMLDAFLDHSRSTYCWQKSTVYSGFWIYSVQAELQNQNFYTDSQPWYFILLKRLSKNSKE